ncbi:chemotaxis protein CheD [Alteribacillus iranensis]|uniref:Probable chemoreceptor glutamine deamidase CheD n=1 Tax=Alteribacillus iranensis TaxID=930128 RepID=A0A1I2A4D9_9BACI|nr:chemotaxis protein CheD [Alteribacillus iranensis]SFE38599.1 chemotaxis protein CheD [Alteribacillus iranensis]
MTSIRTEKLIKVGMADWKLAFSPQVLRTSGLGSCVGIVVYDSQKKVGALSHIMLPDSTLAKDGKVNRAKFADTALNDIVSELVSKGCALPSLKAKMAGGAQMFRFTSGTDMMRIGPRNVDAVKKALMENNIPLLAEDTGGNKGRTITFYPETGCLHIRTIHEGEQVI